jgi:hypothetical protein
LRQTRGAAGLDGWHRDELVAFADHAPWVISELFSLLVRTTWTASMGLPQDLRSSLYAWRIVGIPKRGSDEARPIAIASVMVRAWHRALLPQLPSVPDGQWCGRRGCGVIDATAHWLAAPGTDGAELDLAKAFDTVNLGVAGAALTRFGTPEPVVALLAASWCGPRHCHVDGALAEPINPRRGLPPGCPTSPVVLAAVLAPWNGLIGRSGWAYMDDRSIKCPSARERTRALATTARFDAAIGLLENQKKRQLWSGAADVEHLGLRLQASDSCPRALPRPRDGWEPTIDLARRLALIPGPASVREGLALTFVKPCWSWAAPLLEPPPEILSKTLFRAVLSSRCTWWCAGRWWCDRILLHPVLGTAVHALQRARRLASTQSDMLGACLTAHATKLKLRVVEFSAEHGLWVQPLESADARVLAAAAAARRQMDAPSIALPVNAFMPDHPAGGHAARVCARVAALGQISSTRFDSEGADLIDVEVQSAPAWRKWVAGLTASQRSRLSVWRGGAVFSPTRRWFGSGPPGASCCSFCGCVDASARHYFEECPRFDADRRSIGFEFGIGAAWWRSQPRCTSKSGWVVVTAGRTVVRRATLQVAACSLGLRIVEVVPAAAADQS